MELAERLEGDDGARILRLLLGLRALGSDPGSAPEQRPTQILDQQIGVWDIVDGPAGPGMRRRPEYSLFESNVWADVAEVEGQGDAERVVLIGESSARGYLLDPVLTPTSHLQSVLESGARRFQCIDLARTSADLDELRRLVGAVAQLRPDHLVVYAGNNWAISSYRSELLPELAADMRAGGYPALAEAFDREMLLPSVTTFLSELASLSDRNGIKVVLVVPEFNLTGWSPIDGEDRIEVPALPVTELRRWYRLRADALRARSRREWTAVLPLVEEMSALDGGLSPVPDHLRGEALAALGRPGPAREAYERSRDSIHGLFLKDLPRTPRLVQDLLVEAADVHDFGLVDLRVLFARGDAPGVPDPRHFLDYCHLSDSGISLMMSAVADVIQGRRTPTPPLPAGITDRQRGVSLILAAIYNAYCGQPTEVVVRYMERALAAAPEVRGLLDSLNRMQTRPGPAWANPDFARLVAEPNVARILIPLAEMTPRGTRLWSLREALDISGFPIAAPDHAERTVELIDAECTPLGTGKVPNYTPSRCYLQATTASTSLSFVPAGTAAVRLHILYRMRHPCDEPALFELNGRKLGFLPPAMQWTRAEFVVTENVVAGLNTVTVTWGIPEIDVSCQVSADSLAMERGEFPQILPVFGEIFSLLVDVDLRPDSGDEGGPRSAVSAGDVAALWSEVLGRRVEIDDDFFALGGMSLDAVRIVTRMEDRVGTLLSVRHVLESRTPREMARRLDETFGRA